ncbi:alaserpin [Aphidius gifuensis]|uniref:alaserpin n=1 Tax=Aphidius gifuensis TaxID=684658 RepID=UPI001CDC1775|nr:alaserpin [Aphidius gifuensis]
MTYHGAAEKTRNLFHPVIGHGPESRRTILKAQKEFIKTFKGDSSSGLIWINKIYLADDITINPDFNKIVKSIFQSSARNIDFHDPIEASDTINYQIDDETDSTFSKIVIPADFNRKTQLVLVNAIKFTGYWKFPFDASKTRKEKFQLGGGKTIYVPTMSATFMCDAGTLKNIPAQYVVLLFKVKSSTLRAIEEELKNEKLASIRNWKNKQKQKYHVQLPKFKIESNWNLDEPIKNLGLKNIFTNDANFGRMTDESVSVDKILQNVKINVNEKGCSSSASSSSSYENNDSNESSTWSHKKSTLSVRVDRPFLVFIMKKGVISLSARITKPCFCRYKESIIE